MTRLCIVCDEPLADNTRFCPTCGSRQPDPAASQSPAPPWMVEQPTAPIQHQAASWPDQPSPYAPPGYTQPDHTPPFYPPQPPPNQPPYVPSSYAQAGPPPPYMPQPSVRQPRRSSPGRWLIGAGVLLLLVAGGLLFFQSTRNTVAPVAPPVVAFDPATRTPRPTRTPQPTAEPFSQPTDDPTSEDPAPTFSPLGAIEPNLPEGSGTLVYFSTDTFEVVSKPASGGAVTPLQFDDPYAFFLPGTNLWSPDGQHVVTFAGEDTSTAFHLYNGDGSNKRDLAAQDTQPPFQVWWSPDSSAVAFVSSSGDFSDSSQQNLYVIDVAAGEIRQVTTSGYVQSGTVAWSPDSTQLAYTFFDDAEAQFRVINVDGSAERTLRDELPYSVVWLPDDRLIYEGNCTDSFDTQVCAIDSQAGAEPTSIYALGSASLRGASPNGKWLMLDDFGDNSLSLLNLESGVRETVAPPSEDFLGWGVWSPDNRYVTYQSYSGNGTYVYETGSAQPATPLIGETLLTWLP